MELITEEEHLNIVTTNMFIKASLFTYITGEVRRNDTELRWVRVRL